MAAGPPSFRYGSGMPRTEPTSGMERSAYTDGSAGRRPVLLWRFDPPVRALATAVLGGGLGECSWAINAEVGLDYWRTDPAGHMAEVAGELGLAHGKGVGLLTAARVRGVTSSDDGGVTCDATVGLLVPTWAASDSGADERWVPGTINLVCHVPAPLCDGALVNAVTTATEAKAQALIELGVPGTGTASDAVLITCPPGETETFCGPRSVWGARLARAVRAAVAEGTNGYLGRQK